MNRTRKYALIGIVVLVVISILLVALWQTGFLLPDRRVVSGQGFVPITDETLQQYETQNTAQNSTPSLFFYIMNLTRGIPGMNKVTKQVFYSNASVSSVKNQYDSLLRNQGYSPQPKYTGSYSHWGQSISFHTYNRWSTGIVIILSAYQGKTWICYIIGSVFDLLSIYTYLSIHGYLQ